MEELFEGALELVLDFLEYRFEGIHNPVLRFVVQILAMIAACGLVVAVFIGVWWLVVH